MRIAFLAAIELSALLFLSGCAAHGDVIAEKRTDESIQTSFEEVMHDMYSVYREALKQQPKLGGRVIFRITVSPEGEVIQSRIVSTSLADQGVPDALNEIIRRMRFGKVRHPQNVTFSYPVEFIPGHEQPESAHPLLSPDLTKQSASSTPETPSPQRIDSSEQMLLLPKSSSSSTVDTRPRTYAERVRASIPPVIYSGLPSGNPVTVVEITTNEDGVIVGRRVVKSSGDAAWDRAVYQAVYKADVIPRDVDGNVPHKLEISFFPREPRR